MCLAIPGKIIEIKDDEIILDYPNELRKADITLIPISVGDYVIVSNKIVVSKVDGEVAKKFLSLIKNE